MPPHMRCAQHRQSCSHIQRIVMLTGAVAAGIRASAPGSANCPGPAVPGASLGPSLAILVRSIPRSPPCPRHPFAPWRRPPSGKAPALIQNTAMPDLPAKIHDRACPVCSRAMSFADSRLPPSSCGYLYAADVSDTRVVWAPPRMPVCMMVA